MEYRKKQRKDLTGKTIDSHSHVGINVKAFATLEYPYAATVEGIYYRQQKAAVDVNVVFPFTPEMYFDLPNLIQGNLVKSEHPFSRFPYDIENQMLLKEVYEFCPEISDHFLPFISVDPGRNVKEQARAVSALAERYPVYGIKIIPVFCQTPVTDLLAEGKIFLELASEHNWPILLHTTVHQEEDYSRADMAFKVIERYPNIRFCLAHCIGFHKGYLNRASQMPNVWVDTAALKIQVQLARENSPIIAEGEDLLELDYSSHATVLRELIDQFPGLIVWGSDTPAYSYICRRKQGEEKYVEFCLKSTYEDEIAALNSLSKENRVNTCSQNALDFIFG